MRNPRRPAPVRRAVIAAALLVLSGCAVPLAYPPGPGVTEPVLEDDHFVAPDGARLPLHQWTPDGPVKAVLIALHGFNDYGRFVAEGARLLSAGHGVKTYSIDQRGFGGAPHRGKWAGRRAYGADLTALATCLGKRHPGLPLFVLGESFGGAVGLTAAADGTPPGVDGYILAAPAVWGRAAMPWYQRLSLWIGAHTIPTAALSGRGLSRKPSNNIEMLRRLGRDPKVIKETRVETIYGLVNMMDDALAAAPRFRAPALILYGGKDDIVPREPMLRLVAGLPREAVGRQRFALYEEGHHMLLRDEKPDVYWRDIAAWMRDRTAPLPSGADIRGASAVAAHRSREQAGGGGV